MKIQGIENLSTQDIQREVERGGRFVIYKYCFSILVMTFQRPSTIHFVRSSENRIKKGMPYTLAICLAGWWGIPWGPIYSVGSIWTNSNGGIDVTTDVLHQLIQEASQKTNNN